MKVKVSLVEKIEIVLIVGENYKILKKTTIKVHEKPFK